MDRELAFLVGIAVILAIIVMAITAILRNERKHASTTLQIALEQGAVTAAKVIQDAFNSPVLLELARGATAGVPQDAFNKFILSLEAGRAFTQPEQIKALIAVLENTAKKLDQDPANDPVDPVPIPEGVSPPAAPFTLQIGETVTLPRS